MSAIKRILEQQSLNMGLDGTIDDDVLDAFNRDYQTISSLEIGSVEEVLFAPPAPKLKRSLSRIEEERDRLGPYSIESVVLSQFLCQPNQVGTCADQLRNLDYENHADFEQYRAAVEEDYHDRVVSKITSKEDMARAEAAYQLGWDLFEGVLPVKKVD